MAAPTTPTGIEFLTRPIPIYRAVVTVSNAADTVLSDVTVPGFTGRTFIGIQVQGNASGITVSRAATTGGVGIILDASPAAGQAGGYMAERISDDCPYNGYMSLRALTAPVDVLVEVF